MNPLTMMKVKAEVADIAEIYGQSKDRRESMHEMFAVLVEEVGEVATVLQDPVETNFDLLMIEELAQVAAVAITMIDMIYVRRTSAKKEE